MVSNKIMQSFEDGKINKYMCDKLTHAVEQGVNDNLIDDLLDDAQNASDFGVTGDRDYNIYFFINNLTDDILNDTFDIKLDDDKKKELYRHIFAHKDDEKYKFDNLTDFRLLIYDWLCNKFSKKAYPNISGKNDREPVYDVDKWISTLKNIYNFVRSEMMEKDSAIKQCTQDWESEEKQHFINWLNYYEAGNMEKYNVKNAQLKTEADLVDFQMPKSWVKDDGRNNPAPQLTTQKLDDDVKRKTKREKELDMAKIYKIRMRSRLDALQKLVDKYSDILPKQNLENIYKEIQSLRNSVSKLDVYASMKDCTYRSANIIRKFGFSEGAEFLEKMAEEDNATDARNPQTNANAAISRLEIVSKTLNARDIIRELASIDILLNELGIASYFPELSLSQAKLIEAFSYSSNKIEDIIANLRGGGVNRMKAPEMKAPAIKPPEIKTKTTEVKTVPPTKPMDTGEIMHKPIGEVKQELPTAEPKKTE